MASSAHCRALSHPDPTTVLIAAVLVVGILISYLPQHAKIIQHRTSEGLSPWWVLLGGLSSIAALGNILTLPASREDVRCCREINGGACAAALLGVGQIGLQWSCFMFMYVAGTQMRYSNTGLMRLQSNALPHLLPFVHRSRS